LLARRRLVANHTPAPAIISRAAAPPSGSAMSPPVGDRLPFESDEAFALSSEPFELAEAFEAASALAFAAAAADASEDESAFEAAAAAAPALPSAADEPSAFEVDEASA